MGVCGARCLDRTPAESLEDVVVNLLAVDDAENPDLGPRDLVYHPVISDAQLPIPFQGLFQRRPMLLGGFDQAGLNCAGDSTVDV